MRFEHPPLLMHKRWQQCAIDRLNLESMTQELFNQRKERIRNFATARQADPSTDVKSKNSIETLLAILESYNYLNRLEVKGHLTRTIIDSLELNYSIGEEFIKFDNSIS